MYVECSYALFSSLFVRRPPVCWHAASFLKLKGKRGKGGGRTKIFLSKKGMGMLASRGIRNPGEGGGGGLRIPTITTISLSIS